MDKLDQLAVDSIQRCQQTLVRFLPMSDPNFMQVLFKHELLNDEVKREIHSKNMIPEKASIFLEFVMGPGTNYIKFKKLLLAMKETSYKDVVDLAYELQLLHIILRKNVEHVQSK